MPLITRVSTIGLQQASLGDMTRLQSELGNLQQQISGGRNARSFQELSARGQTERILSFENQSQRADSYIRNNIIINNRTESYNSATSNLIDVAEQLRNLLVQRRTPTSADSLPFTELTDSYLATIKANLNTQIEGRYLFAGSKTDTRPVNNIETANYTFDPVTGKRVFNNKYYEGDNVTLTTQASDTLTLDYGVTASDPAFQELIGAIHLALEGHNKNDDSILSEAVELVTKTISDLTTVQAKLNNNITILNQTNIEHTDLKTFFDQSVNDVTETDVGAATIRLSSIQTTLQASFLAYSKITSLKLSDFLR